MDLFGRHGNSQHALDSLNGRMPPDIETLMPETINLLPVLAQPHPSLVKSHPTITPEEFINLYRALPKDTSMSPSRRHIGHYKATLKYPQLIFLHTTMMSLPFQCGVIPVRWTRVTDTDIMLEKESGNPWCHRLRIITLFESNFSQAKCLLLLDTWHAIRLTARKALSERSF